VAPPPARRDRGTEVGIIVRVLTGADIPTLIADTEQEILRLIGDRDGPTRGLYEMIRYHMGLDGSGAPAGKRMRPLLGLLAYLSIKGSYAEALPGAAAVELGHNFSLVHDDIEDGDRERRHRATLWTLHGVPQAVNTGTRCDQPDRAHRLSDIGFSDARVLRLMRLFDQTCLTSARSVHRHLDERARRGRRSTSTST
jgi:geranylgeranyl diphosphate synthase type I